MSLFYCLGRTEGPEHMYPFRNEASFYGEELSTTRPTSKLYDHLLSAVLDCLFNILAATDHIGGRSLHPQPEDAPCSGDRNPLIMAKKCI